MTNDIDSIINEAAKFHGVNPELIRRVMRKESRGNSRAVSPKGASGLMQLMPETAKEM
jgi:soluble lytic murein transglycosylase-like protein